MLNMKKWGAALAFVALVAVASPPAYKFLSRAEPATDPSELTDEERAELAAGSARFDAIAARPGQAGRGGGGDDGQGLGRDSGGKRAV